MARKPFLTLMMAVILVLPALGSMPSAPQNRTLVIAGYPGELPVMELSGRAYAEIDGLARLTNGSLSFSGSQIVLTLPSGNAPTSPASASEFSKQFLRAGIEEMAVIREWRTALKNAVKQGYPVTEQWTTTYRDQAQQSLRLVGVAASTDSDRNALQLLTIEFNNMKKLSDRFVEANKSQTYLGTDALDNDPLDKSILTCARSLAALASNGQFVDDGTCQ